MRSITIYRRKQYIVSKIYSAENRNHIYIDYLYRSNVGLILFWNIIPRCKNIQKQKTIFKHKKKNINIHFMLYIEFELLYERVYLYPKYRSHMIYKWLNYIPPQHKIKWIHVHEFFKWSMQEWIFVQFCFLFWVFNFQFEFTEAAEIFVHVKNPISYFVLVHFIIQSFSKVVVFSPSIVEGYLNYYTFTRSPTFPDNNF